MAFIDKITINGSEYNIQHLTDGQYSAMLPVLAQNDTLMLKGAITPKTTDMIQEVGVDNDGKLWTGSSGIRYATISMPAIYWSNTGSPYSQTVTVNNITNNSKIDLQPTVEQLSQLQDAETALMVVNDNGVVTAYAIGSKPTVDYTIQATIVEIER